MTGDHSSGTGKWKETDDADTSSALSTWREDKNGGWWQQQRSLFENLIRVLGWCNIQQGDVAPRVPSHCSGEAFVGIMILESICWMRGTGNTHGTRVWTRVLTSKVMILRYYFKLGLRADDKSLLYLYSTPPHPSPPVARRHSWCLLWTEGLCRLPTKHTRHAQSRTNRLVCV